MEPLEHLLFDSEHIQIQNYELDCAQQQVRIYLCSTPVTAACPVCGQAAHRVHSHYERTLGDLPWADYQVRIQIEVQKFFCDHSACPRRILSERLNPIAAPWARRTRRLNTQLSDLGLALGGAAGVKLGQKLHCQVSRNTILRLVMRLPLPQFATPKILGVDDFAFRKRRRYGTILVDLDTRRPIELLEGRSGEPIASWLKQHPGVGIVSRDRSSAYRSGITAGAPNATQVADRFHLLQNLATVLEQILRTQTQSLKAIGQIESVTVTAAMIADAAQLLSGLVPKSEFGAEGDETMGSEHWQQRSAIHQQVWDLHRQGWSTAAIAQHVGMSIRTVQRDLRKPEFADPQPRSDDGDSLAAPYRNYILEQYQRQGGRPRGLLQALQQRGYQGGDRTLRRYLQWLREQKQLIIHPQTSQSAHLTSSPPALPLTANRATWLIMQLTATRAAERQQVIQKLKAQSSTLKTAIELTESFCDLIRKRQPNQFEPWLNEAATCGLLPFQKFAAGLREDGAAVKAAMTLPVSNGVVEGHVNRLKMLKRQMYGRAGDELLKRRVLLAS